MRRPTPDVLLTVVLVVVLAAAGAGVALVGRDTAGTAEGGPAPGPSLEAPPPPSSSPPEPRHGPRRDHRPRQPRTPKPPAITATSCPDLSEEVPLRVVSLNIHFGFGPTGFDLPLLASTISRWDADVVLLQEVDRFRRRSRYLDVPAELARLTGMEVAFGANVRRGRSEYGVATLSRFPIVRDSNTLLPNRPGSQQRGLLRTDIDIDGSRVSVFNTHLQNGPDVKALRVRQLAAIRPLVRASPHPAIFGGDLNSGPTSPMLDLAGTFARDVWLDVGSGRGRTAPAAAPRFRIDYLMYTQPLHVTGATVLPQVISDHRAVRADLVLSVAGDEVCVPELDGPVGGSGPGNGAAGRARYAGTS